MRKWIILVTTVLAGCGSYANAAIMGEFDIDAGYRRDNIDWRYRCPSHDPEVKSNTKFKSLDIFQLSLDARAAIGYNFYTRGNAYFGWILDGDFENSAHAYFSPSYGSSSSSGSTQFGFSDKKKSTITDQYVFGVNAAVGYPFFFCDCTALLAPVIGYSFDEQNCKVDSKELAFAGSSYSHFDSQSSGGYSRTFISRWYGPFVGLDFDWRPYFISCSFWAEAEYHFGDFRGKRSFTESGLLDSENRHSKNANAWVFSAGIDYELCSCWALGLAVKFQDWEADRHGHTHFSYYSGSSESRNRQNNHWNSYAINLTLGHEF